MPTTPMTTCLPQTNALGETWTYAYDARSNLTRITSPGNKVTAFAYDAKGQVTSVTDSKGNSTTYAYDGFGNRLTITDAAGQDHDLRLRQRRHQPHLHGGPERQRERLCL